jgi:hypothetical protein
MHASQHPAMLAGEEHCLLGHGLCQLFKWTPTHLISSGRAHEAPVLAAVCL